MGISLPDDELPVLKQNNAIIALNEKDARLNEESACIRCGRCAMSCPMGLLPIEISNAVDRKDFESMNKYYIQNCMECGCCSFVCPAKRPLVQQNKLAKAKLMPWLKEQAAKKEEKK